MPQGSFVEGRPLLLVAAAALLDGERRVLLTQRPPGKALAGAWEFPGGKVETGEAPETALVRELREELGIAVAPAALEPFAFASHAYERFHLLMPLYLVSHWQGELRGHEGQAMQWIRPADMRGLEMPPADYPLVERLIEAFG